MKQIKLRLETWSWRFAYRRRGKYGK